MLARILISGIVTVLMVTFGSLAVEAQQQDETDICVFEHLTASSLTGKVVSAKLDAEIEKPLAGATVELRRIGEQEVIAKTRTDTTGHFAFRANSSRRVLFGRQAARFVSVCFVCYGCRSTSGQTQI